uniref:BSD domain-containing protein n=1 Tax=Quercus lobata TaxID=97700 RepID=A0A7N2MB97_QUELO
MSKAQEEHVLAIQYLAPRLVALRIELCLCHMSERSFWKVYFGFSDGQEPYEADLGHLLAFCVAGRDMWRARVPLVCFCIVETHHPDRVLRQFGLAQEEPVLVDTSSRLHAIDLRGKVDKNWREEYALYIREWDT